MKTYLEYKDETSNKFWEIEVVGNKHIVTFGKIGTNGQTQEKEFPDSEQAEKEAKKLIDSKIKKGYSEKNNINELNEKYIKNYKVDYEDSDPLVRACEKKDINLIKSLLENGHCPNSRDILHYGYSPLHAVLHNKDADIELARLLISYNATLVKNHFGKTPLDAYLEYDSLYEVEDDTERKKRDDIINLLKTLDIVEVPTDIFECVINGDYKNLEKILDEDDSFVDVESLFGYTPMGECIYQSKEDNNNYIKCIKILIEHNADIDFVSNNGGHDETPLTLAIKKKNIKIIKLLLENGADVNLSIEFDETPLIYALKNTSNDFDIIKLLLEKGASVNFQTSDDPDYTGYSPLHFAVEDKDVELVKLFIKYGADVNLTDEEGRRPIELLYRDYDMDEGFDYDNDEEELDDDESNEIRELLRIKKGK